MSDNDDYFSDEVPDDYSDEERNHIAGSGTATWGNADAGQGNGDGNGATAEGGSGTREGEEGKFEEQNSSGVHDGWGGNDWKSGTQAEKPSFKAAFDLGADEFSERMKMFQGPTVKLLVGPEKVAFNVPRELLCKNSPFFDCAFNGPFKEGIDESIHLKEDNVTSVQMMLQWIYTGQAKLPRTSWGLDLEKVEIYLDFFKLADKIDLLGPFSSVVEQLRTVLCACRTDRFRALVCDCPTVIQYWSPDHAPACAWSVDKNDPIYGSPFNVKHIKTAFELRSGHLVRDLMAQACVTSYFWTVCTGRNFKYAEELKTIDGFATVLLREFAQAMSTKVPGKDTCSIKDPLTGHKYQF